VISQLGIGILLGLTVLVLGPPLLQPTRFGMWLANAYAAIAMQTLGRPSISVGANTDLSLRKRSFDDTYDAETLTIGGEEKKITMTSGTTLRWGNRSFTFVEEKFGSTFDLRDVAFGRAFMELVRDGSFAYDEYLRDDDGKIIGVRGYVRAFLEPAEGPYKMDLGESVRPMIDGNEDATAWNRVYEGVRRMFIPYQDAMPVMKLALPGVMLFAGVMGGYYLFGPGQLPGGTATRTVGVGAGSVLPWLSWGGSDGDDSSHAALDWFREWRGVLGAGLMVAGGLLFAFQAAPATTAIVVVGVAGTVVASALGSASVISLLPARLSEPFAEAWMTVGLKGVDDPIITQDDNNCIRVDDGDDDGPRYRLCKSFVGFDLDVSPAAFGRAGATGKELAKFEAAMTDGGEADLPADLVATKQITNADHTGLVPNVDPMADSWSERRQKTFVRTDRWLSRFTDAATGKICERAQQEATKEFADGKPEISDRRLIMLSIGAGVGGLLGSFVLWGLLL
jgi:hypothetical protein